MTKDDLDIIKVTKWECPSETGIPLITMPNIPKPLHALPPRNVMGKTAWDRARKLCYFKADYKCEICGCIWQANKNEYKEDWSKYSIPVYCKCPCCKTEVYAIGTFQDDLPKHSHIKED